ncbi:MAG: Hsp70 family protein, partial [Candidatus Binatia bacterium]
LSTKPFTRIEEEFVAERKGAPLHLSMEVDRSDYERLIRPLVERSLSSVQTALHDAGHLASDMDELILVGGSTRTPLIQRELEERTGFRPRFEIDPDLCVALGAATQAAIIAGDEARSVLIDITPHTLGIRCLTTESGSPNFDHFSRIIRKGTPLPSARSEVYSTAWDDQEAVRIEVFQGEDDDARRNTSLGTVSVEGLTPGPAGNPIVVDFQMTLDGTLTVTATEKLTGLRKSVVIDDAIHSLSEDERAAAVERVKGLLGGGDGSGERSSAAGAVAGAERRLEEGAAAAVESEKAESVDREFDADGELRATVERIRRLLDTMGSEDREDAALLIERAKESLKSGRTDEVRELHEEMKELIFYVEES